MSKDLIIVESPAKVKTIKKFLGTKFMVQASVGHIRDLPSKEIGVDEETFEPRYVTITGKEKVVSSLQEAAAKADTVYLAPDPDREGEAIAWHIAEVIKSVAKDIKRIQFNEITAKAVKEALANPRDIDPRLFEAQQARRVLDRLVGYKISPLLWKSVKRGISAGRVQSVALRLVVEREEERLAFVPEEFWNFKAMVNAEEKTFKLDLTKINQKKAVIPNEEMALAVEKALQAKDFVVEKVEEKERSRSPQPPFTTSTLQQAANQRLGFSAKRTMTTAQRLYEGIDIEGQGTLALITYMRTDSVRIAAEAITAATEFIQGTYGEDFIAAGGKGRAFKGKKSVQDAHEAIRPVDVSVTPEQIKHALTPEQFRLYSLIWARFVASQMAAARFHDTVVTVSCQNPDLPSNASEVEEKLYPFHSQWRAKGERMLFPGFLKVLSSTDEKVEELPALTQGKALNVESIIKEQKFTQPSPRYSEASLVRELEEKGIGRPSTYATIISTIQDREYVRLDSKHFVPTDLGNVVCSQLRDNFPKLMNVDFTANMEENLDKVAEGEMGWVNLLSDFNGDFVATLEKASKEMKGVKTGIETNVPCPKCGKNLAIKFGKSGEFLACSGYPECRFTSNFTRDENGEIQLQAAPEYEVVGECPKCKGDVVLKKAHTGSRFLACANYPKCDFAAPYSTGVKCPRCEDGVLVEKSSKRGKIFYSCNTYPKCDYALWDFPIAEACPQCDSPILVRKHSKVKGDYIACPESACKYTRTEIPLDEDAEGTATQNPIAQSLLLATSTKLSPSKSTAKSKKSAEKADKEVANTTETKGTKGTETQAEEKPKRTRKKKEEAPEAESPAAEAEAKPKAKRVSKKAATEATTEATVSASVAMPKNIQGDLKQIKIYTDGSCLGNPGNGAYAGILEFDGKKKEIVGGFTHTTNNRMELLAVVEALNVLKEPCDVELYTDSQYVAKAINAGWLEGWKKNGWKTAAKKPVKNQDLWIRFDEAVKKHNVSFRWVKGHAGHPENERCDELARTEAAKPDLPQDTGYSVD